jgi:organic radical activating enzyme
MPMEIISVILADNKYEHIILSGGEPLSHPKFYDIFNLCRKHTADVVVYSNLITHRAYNPSVIDGVYLEAKLTITDDTNKVSILKRIKQGRESTRPEVSFSRNYTGSCPCDNHVVKPNGKIVKTPCDKYTNGSGE